MAAGGAHTDGSGLLNAAGSSAKSEDPARTALREKKRRKKAAKTPVQHKIKSIIREAKELVRHGNLQEAILTYDRALEAIQWNRAVLLQKSGQLNAAYDAYIQVLDSNPGRTGVWERTSKVLRQLGRADEVPNLIGRMISALPWTTENLLLAASIARRSRQTEMADDLMRAALAPGAGQSRQGVLEGARIMLGQGEHGRVIQLLEENSIAGDEAPDTAVADLLNQALSQLRTAGKAASEPVHVTDRADLIAFQTILDCPYQPPLSSRRGIVVVTNSLGPGGLEKQAVEFVRQLRSAAVGYSEPIYLLPMVRSKLDPSFFASALTGLGVTVACAADASHLAAQVEPPELAERLALLPQNIAERVPFLINRFRAYRPRAVLALSETNGLAASVAASLAGIPRILISVRGEPPAERGLRGGFLKPAFQVAIARNRISLVSNSKATAQKFAEWLELPSDRVGVIYNGVDVEALLAQRDATATAEHRRMLGIPPTARVVGSVFSARSEKRPTLWIEAAAIIAKRAPEVAFVVVGGAHMPNDALNTLKRHQLDACFHAPGLKNDIATWLDLMDVALLTSKTEGTPNVLLEAQALGLPVVATDVGGCAESFIPGVTGILLTANPTPREVADAVLRVLGDRTFTDQAREKGPAFIRQRFCSPRMASEFLRATPVAPEEADLSLS